MRPSFLKHFLTQDKVTFRPMESPKLRKDFRHQATNKGVYEVTPSESTVLAKSLVDIASLLKEIKEGQKSPSTLLKCQPNTSQQKPAKRCEICSCNSHYTNECPQLQEDNTIASTHNFFDGTTIPPYNKQYYTQGWRDNQPTH
ncbi:hypothetical protein PIB30_085050 [Stylosanthes scabra]|uniref:Uncharacterized protein n=1 Tax=Stylosanthes scabra TaxID=79078 RepID=A0ABU6SU32_9FABA|nr:hypothetical protein [Stylosanthes scabra]